MLFERDRGCRHPGCCRTRHLHAHHVRLWRNGGTTDADNLILLCSNHNSHRLATQPENRTRRRRARRRRTPRPRLHHRSPLRGMGVAHRTTRQSNGRVTAPRGAWLQLGRSSRCCGHRRK
ncbi:HNH endonuclease signature motif containing protein [Williamsia limnetica]|uniref:HNH endonuclease signature motif containing protein n=1 Tax=Williamsia limnetica TaxID=882452 RepID=UPI00319DE759